LAEENGVETFENSREGVIRWNSIGQREPFFKPLAPDLAELFHQFIRFHSAYDAGKSHEDDLTEMMKCVAIFSSVLERLEHFEIFREAAGVVGLIRISRHLTMLANLDIAYRLNFDN